MLRLAPIFEDGNYLNRPPNEADGFDRSSPGPTRLRNYPGFFRFVARVIDWPVLGFDSPKKTVLYSTVPGSLVYYTDEPRFISRESCRIGAVVQLVKASPFPTESRTNKSMTYSLEIKRGYSYESRIHI